MRTFFDLTPLTIAGTTPLAGYKEGTWAPVAYNLAGTPPMFTGADTRIGRVIFGLLRLNGTTYINSG